MTLSHSVLPVLLKFQTSYHHFLTNSDCVVISLYLWCRLLFQNLLNSSSCSCLFPLTSLISIQKRWHRRGTSYTMWFGYPQIVHPAFFNPCRFHLVLPWRMKTQAVKWLKLWRAYKSMYHPGWSTQNRYIGDLLIWWGPTNLCQGQKCQASPSGFSHSFWRNWMGWSLWLRTGTPKCACLK